MSVNGSLFDQLLPPMLSSKLPATLTGWQQTGDDHGDHHDE
jgi:hypothetical protein